MMTLAKITVKMQISSMILVFVAKIIQVQADTVR